MKNSSWRAGGWKTIVHVWIWMLVAILAGCAARLPHGPRYDYSGMDKRTRDVHEKMEQLIRECVFTHEPIRLERSVRIDSIFVDPSQSMLRIDCNKVLSYVPFRPDNTTRFYSRLRELLGRRYRSYSIQVRSLQVPIEELIPNVYRGDFLPVDRSRLPKPSGRAQSALIRRVSEPWRAEKGLQDRNIALWHSHGWY